MLRNKFIVILLLQLSRSDNEEPNSLCICNYTLQVNEICTFVGEMSHLNLMDIYIYIFFF